MELSGFNFRCYFSALLFLLSYILFCLVKYFAKTWVSWTHPYLQRKHIPFNSWETIIAKPVGFSVVFACLPSSLSRGRRSKEGGIREESGSSCLRKPVVQAERNCWLGERDWERPESVEGMCPVPSSSCSLSDSHACFLLAVNMTPQSLPSENLKTETKALTP